MKIARCSQNNLSRLSFGLTVDFHADDKTKAVKLPNYDSFHNAMFAINFSPEAECMRPSTVYLKHEDKKVVPLKVFGVKVWSKVVDVWQVVSGELKSEPFEIPRRKTDSDTIERKLSLAVREVCNKVCSDPLGALVKDLNLKDIVV